MRQLTLDEMIDRYEAALSQARWNTVDLRQYVPSAVSPEYWPALVELLRIRMEHAFEEDPTFGIEQCVREFPGLLQNSDHLAELAYEEFRLRQHAGQTVSPAEYQQRWDIDTSSWKCLAGPKTCEENAGKSSGWSSTSKRNVCDIALNAGELFGPFRILCLLGRGALAKVYLAQQLDLSERAVVLKVCAQATLEPQKIALLQHPHIVQIFSVHEIAGFQVLCMPYAGATTLADLLVSHRASSADVPSPNAHTRTSHQLVTTLSNRQREVQTLVDNSPTLQNSAGVQLNHGLTWPKRWHNMRYEDIVCELMLQLAQGLSHAHHHGIVHSDLKPANVLIGDDGQARLVDFNVAQRDGDARRSLLGGTLPYMAPEHIRSLRNDRWEAGPASDLYSLGVIAFQLLSGKLPFATPAGASNEALDACLAERQNLPVKQPLTARHASADVRSIIEKLLQPQLEQRYNSADQLTEDLQRHLHHLPLRHAANRSFKQRLAKWTIRHPRISSATTVTIVSTLAMLMMSTALVYYRVQYRTEQAQQLVAQFQSELPTALLMAAHYREYGDLETPTRDATTALLNTLLTPNSEVPRVALDYLPASDKALLAANLRELDKVLSLSGEDNVKTTPQLISLARSANSLADRLNKNDLLDSVIETSVHEDFRDMTQATKAYTGGETVRAIELLTTLVERTPHYHAAWLLLGICHQRVGNSELADAAYSTNLALMPKHWQAWYYRAQLLQASAVHSQRKDQLKMAEAHYTRALQLRPGIGSALFNRALCREGLGMLDEALADANQLVENSQELIRAHLLLARIYRRQGDKKSAETHTQKALASQPVSNRDYVYLGSAQLSTDRQAAAENFRRAFELNPQDAEALQSLAYLSMELKSDDSTEKWLNLWVAASPLNATPVASRAVYWARQGKLEQARADCEAALRLRPKPREQAQIASAWILMAEKSESADEKKSLATQAIALLIKAVQSEYQLVGEIAQDADMKSLHNDSRFQSLVKVAIAFGQLPKLTESSTIAP